MKIAYNPKTEKALSAIPLDNNITFDLPARIIYAKGVGFQGTDTTYEIVTKTADGLVPKFDGIDGTITNESSQVLTNNNGKIGWYNLTASTFYTSLSDFTSDATHRLVTDTQIALWDSVYNIMNTDSDTVINKWQEVVDFLATYTEANTLSTLLSNKVNKDLIVTSTTSGLAPKITNSSGSTINNLTNEWILTSTKGGDPTWRRLPLNAFLNTTYSAGTGLALDGTTFKNTGVLSVTSGTTNGTIKVNNIDVSVKGLGSAAYTNSGAYAPATHTHNYTSTIKVGNTPYNVNDNIITLPAYPTNADTINNYRISVGSSVGTDPKTIYFVV